MVSKKISLYHFLRNNFLVIIYCLLVTIVLLVFLLYNDFTRAEVYVCYYGEREPWITDNTMFSYAYKEVNPYKDTFLGFKMICNSTLYNRMVYKDSFYLQKSVIDSMN